MLVRGSHRSPVLRTRKGHHNQEPPKQPNKRTSTAPEGARTPNSARKRKRQESTSEREAGIPESQVREPAAANVGSDGSPTSGRGADDANERETDFRVEASDQVRSKDEASS